MAVVLFAVGALFSLWESWRRIARPHEVESLPWAIGVLAVAMVFESVALRRAVNTENHERDWSWWHDIRTTKDPENSVVC